MLINLEAFQGLGTVLLTCKYTSSSISLHEEVCLGRELEGQESFAQWQKRTEAVLGPPGLAWDGHNPGTLLTEPPQLQLPPPLAAGPDVPAVTSPAPEEQQARAWGLRRGIFASDAMVLVPRFAAILSNIW